MLEPSKWNRSTSNRRSSCRTGTQPNSSRCSLSNPSQSSRIILTKSIDCRLSSFAAGYVYPAAAFTSSGSRCTTRSDGDPLENEAEERAATAAQSKRPALAPAACFAVTAGLRSPRIFQIPKPTPATSIPPKTQSIGADHLSSVPDQSRITWRP
jgi:hypothetical protein